MQTLVVSKIKLYQEARKKDILGKDHYKMNGPHAVAALGRHFLRGDVKESLLAVAVNTKNEVIAVYTVFTGTINSIVVSPREVMQFALLNNASSLALIHNHPSGTSEPSSEDVIFTNRVQMAGDLLNIELLDHVVITDDDHSSIRSMNPELFERKTNKELEAFVADERGGYDE
ncbi:JAB domain-containing protein [Salinicoccus roseus]|uniref:JAB domain-containing protein n=1 Tax=Salinicoccus roseus TaxID=45670 RepID=UPI003DA0EBD7